MSATVITTGSVAAASFRPAPLRPDQILAGTPEARTLDIGKSEDRNLSFNLWDCTAGRFRWQFQADEFIHVLEGSVTVTPEGGTARTLTAGDVAYFPEGLVTVWEIPTYLKKLAVHRSIEVPLPQRLLRKVKKLVGPASFSGIEIAELFTYASSL